MQKIVTSGAIIGLVLCLNAATAWAQAPGWGNSQQMVFEDGNFNNFAKANPQIAQELTRDPNLVNNPNYLASHPALQTFMQKYPNAAASLRSNPRAFLRQDYARTTGQYPNSRNRGSYGSGYQHQDRNHHHQRWGQ